MASFDQKLRTLYLMEILLERTDDEHMLNASELCTILDQEYGISTDRRTIYTEMEILEKFGLDIQQKKGKCPGYYIGARDFELPELKLLVDAAQSSKFITEKKSKELIQKLEKLCCKTDICLTAELLQFLYQFLGFLFCDKFRRLSCIHQELQLRQLKIPGANIISWALAFLLLDIQSEFFKDLHLCINCSSVRTDPIFLIQNRA